MGSHARRHTVAQAYINNTRREACSHNSRRRWKRRRWADGNAEACTNTPVISSSKEPWKCTSTIWLWNWTKILKAKRSEPLDLVYIYIYILVCSYAYPCTDECGCDVKVGLVVKLIGGKVWITNSITRANEMWARSPKLALSRRTLHYPKVIWTTIGINVGTIVEVGTISAYLSLSKC